jgi:hypothetical protein
MECATMLEAEPELFYITDHYRKFPFVLVRLSAHRTVLKECCGPGGAAGGDEQARGKRKPSLHG